MTLGPFFEPRSVALIGAAHTEAKLGGVILRNLTRFRGKVYPVNPKYRELMGLRSWGSVEDLPEAVDLCIIIRPSVEVPGIVAGLKGRARAVIVVSAGFAEAGQVGLQEELLSVCRQTGLRLVGPNCMGIYSFHRGLDTLFLTLERLRRPRGGPVAVVSQSGAVLSCLFSGLRASNIGVSRAVHYGNAADIDEGDIYEYLRGDRKTSVVISYVESVADGRRFVESAHALAREKHFLILKAGKAEPGQAAAFSHTGRLAGRYEVFSSVLRQFRLREARDFDGFIDSAKAISFQQPRPGNRVLIITNGGGSGVLAADECSRQGLEVIPLSEAVRERLKPRFPDFYVLKNPVDLTAQVKDVEYGVVLREAFGGYDGFLIIALTGVSGITESLAGTIADFRETCLKPLVVHIANEGLARRLSRRLERCRVPVYPSPERAVRGLRALLNERG